MSIDGYINAGEGYRQQNSPEQAISCYDRALELLSVYYDDDIYNELMAKKACALLLSGDFKKGFELAEYRNKLPFIRDAIREYAIRPEWTGQNISGKRILVVAEQGFGDIIQFARYLPFIKELGGIVVFQVKKSVIPFFKEQTYIDEIVELPTVNRANGIEFDYWIKIMSLANVFQCLPTTIPYILPNRGLVDSWSNYFDSKNINIGLIWNTCSPFNLDRVIPIEFFKEILEMETKRKISFYSVQKYLAPEWQHLQKQITLENNGIITDLTGVIAGGDELAAVIYNLDLLISIDTSIIHLAGAMGKEVWTLLPFSADWRWMINYIDTPWYPTMKLFRQSNPGKWNDVIKRIHVELSNWVLKKEVSCFCSGLKSLES